MLDLSLLQQILKTLGSASQLILVGDPNQLMSVGTGTVLGDLVAALADDPHLLELKHNFRVSKTPQLVELNNAALRNDIDTVIEQVDGLVDVQTPEALRRHLQPWIAQLKGRIQVIAESTADVSQRVRDYLELARQQQMLAAVRQGPWGVFGLNAAIEQELRSVANANQRSDEYFEGRRLIVTENNAALGLFNGDIGVCVVGNNGEREVWFESLDELGAPVLRSVAPNALPAHQPAWALTIHKSQGSEFEQLVIVLPNDESSRILSRQLIYTAVSRAKGTSALRSAADAVQIWGRRDVLENGLNNVATRMGGLRDMLTRPR